MLSKFKTIFSIIFLLTICYFVLYTWLMLPPLALFLGWQPDTEFRVLQLVEEGYGQYVEPGDVVLAIDGRPIKRGQPAFVTPVKVAYELTIQRGQEIFTQEVVISESSLFQVWQLSTAILALAIWFIGFMSLQFARPEQDSAIYVGLGFQLIATGLVSSGPSQLGAPGAWLVGHVLIFYFPLIMLYLAFVPYHAPLATWARRLLYGAFCLLTGLVATALIEGYFLFPESSFRDLTGISLMAVLTILAGTAVVITTLVLLIRLGQSPRHSYERKQLAILFTFLALAVIPLFFFVILPVRQILFVPYPFIYSLFLLAPAGYFFILHRQGHLALDALFARIVTLVLLILAIGMAYTTGIYLLDALFNIRFNSAGQGTFNLLLFGIALISHKQVQSGVDLLLYGSDSLTHHTIQKVSARLAANPEPATVKAILSEVAVCLNVQEIALMVKEQEQYKCLAGNIPTFILPNSALFNETLLRSGDAARFINLPVWVELSIPIQAGDDMLGLLLLSRPENGYFNARQVAMLQAMAEILAFGLLVISLVETMHTLSQAALYAKELQRRQIATEIHNEPLQTLTTLAMQLQTSDLSEDLENPAKIIRQVTNNLRRIISGLRSPVLKESVEWIVRQIVREFNETHDDITIATNLDVRSGHQASEQTKLAFYYVLTEALNNVSKHAEATRVDVVLCYSEEILALEVQDNGVGIGDASLSLAGLLREQHIGLADMHQWASIGGGKLTIGANTPTGTIIKLTLPIQLETNQ